MQQFELVCGRQPLIRRESILHSRVHGSLHKNALSFHNAPTRRAGCLRISASADAGMERDNQTEADSAFTDGESSSGLGSRNLSPNIEKRDWTYDEGSGPSRVGGGGMTWEIEEFERKQLIRQVERSAARMSIERQWVDSDDEREFSSHTAVGTDTVDGTPSPAKTAISDAENAVPAALNDSGSEAQVPRGSTGERQSGFPNGIQVLFKSVGALIGVIVTSLVLRPVRVLRSKVLGVLPWLDSAWWNVESVNGKSSGQESDTDKDDGDADMWRAMGKLWSFCAPNRGFIAAATVCLILAAVSEVAIPHFLAATIFAASSGLKEQFVRNTQFLVVMTLACGVFSGLRGACFTVLNVQMVKRMRGALFTRLLQQEIAFFDVETVGDLTSRLGSDCQQVAHSLATDINIMVRNTLQGIGALVILFTLSVPMALFTAGLCLLLWCLLMAYGRFQRRSSSAIQDTVAKANEIAEESFSLVRLIRTFGSEQSEISRYDLPLQRLIDIEVKRSAAYGLWTFSGNTIYNITQVLALLAGGASVMSGQLTAEQLTKFLLYAEWVVHATWWVGDHWGSLCDAVGACHRVFDLLDRPPAAQLSQAGIIPGTSLSGRIEFNNVSFTYPSRPTVKVLDNVSLTVEPGEVVALVGLSGSGKSTIAGLLMRFYDPTAGQVLVDGIPLSDMDAAWFRQQLGVVSQEPRLFSTTVSTNIAYGNVSGISQEDIVWAAKQANAHDFISALPDGYDTVVDNSRLSGGQKQRIAIARALVRDPAILVLDEATSALDAQSEHTVQVALDAAMRRGVTRSPGKKQLGPSQQPTDGNGALHGNGALSHVADADGPEVHHASTQQRTTIVIAHRLSTIQSANRIVVMSGGRIVEMGTHSELLSKDGEYKRLYARQLQAL